jgi:hypothetical protein
LIQNQAVTISLAFNPCSIVKLEPLTTVDLRPSMLVLKRYVSMQGYTNVEGDFCPPCVDAQGHAADNRDLVDSSLVNSTS